MTPKKDSEFHRPATPVAPRKPALTLQKLKEQVDRMDAEPMLTLEQLFLDRSDEATGLLERFVSDQLPDPPDHTLQHWIPFAGCCVLIVVLGVLMGVRLDQVEQRAGKLQTELAALEQDTTKLGARVMARETVGVPIVEGGTAPSFVVTRTTDIVLDLDQPCWLRVTDGDGKVLSAGFVPAGRSEAAPGAKMPLTIRDGCPGHVAFTVDGQPVDPPREPGHAQNRVEVVTLGVPSVKPQSYIYAAPEEREPCSGRCA